MKKLDSAGKSAKEIISDHYRKIAERSHAKVMAKYGKEHYLKMNAIRWAGHSKKEKGLNVVLK